MGVPLCTPTTVLASITAILLSIIPALIVVSPFCPTLWVCVNVLGNVCKLLLISHHAVKEGA